MISYKYTGGIVLQLRAKQLTELTPSEKLVLITLCSFAGDDAACWPSQKELADVTGLSLRSINGCIKGLSDKHYIEKHDRHLPNSKAKTTSYYLLTAKVVPDSKVKRSKVVDFQAHKGRKQQTTEEKLTDRSWDEIQVTFDV